MVGIGSEGAQGVVSEPTLLRRQLALAREELAQARDEVAGLRLAVESNRRIGAAVGVVMALNQVTEEKAFDLLRVASQQTNRKLYDIAADVLDTGVVPVRSGTDAPGSTGPTFERVPGPRRKDGA